MSPEPKYTCKRCGKPARGEDELCDGCWEIESRVKDNPGLARKILGEIGEIEVKQVTTDQEFRAVLELIMVSDPYPIPEEGHQLKVEAWADKEARARGYGSWIEAYHQIK